jgi:hypothetical protein
VVGGTFLFDLINRIDFKSIVLFDSNIAEFAKVTSILNELNYNSDVNPFINVEKNYSSQNKSLMPQAYRSNLTWEIDESAFWEFEGRKSTVFPWLLPSSDFPEYAWNVDKENRQTLLKRMKESLVQTVFPELPHLDFSNSRRRDLVVIFASNIPKEVMSDDYLRSQMTGSAGTIVIRTCDNQSNEVALDPHSYWEALALSLIVKKSHQVWPKEDRHLIGSHYDDTTDSSSLIGEDIPEAVNSVIFHMVFGKSKKKLETQKKLFIKTIASLPHTVGRIIVSEFTPEGKRAIVNYFGTTEEMQKFISNLVPLPFNKIVYAPGGNDLRRSMFLVYE